MTQQEKDLWKRIEAFELDKPEYSLKFSDRLARENGWSVSFALRVISEYKRFIFLCMISREGVTPSDAVDQVWHLHLTYTKSYWCDLCRDTLEKELHHTPTEGGDREAQKFENYYDRTHALYAEKFGDRPPPDIWPDSKTRFSDTDFVRVNKRNHHILIKRRWWEVAIRMAVIIGAGFFLATISHMIIFLFVGIGASILAALPASAFSGLSDKGSGCSAGGCSGCGGGDSGHGHSGCSGCSGSGCSGCSGCGGGD